MSLVEGSTPYSTGLTQNFSEVIVEKRTFWHWSVCDCVCVTEWSKDQSNLSLTKINPSLIGLWRRCVPKRYLHFVTSYLNLVQFKLKTCPQTDGHDMQMTAASCREEDCIIADTARIDRTVQ